MDLMAIGSDNSIWTLQYALSNECYTYKHIIIIIINIITRINQHVSIICICICIYIYIYALRHIEVMDDLLA